MGQSQERLKSIEKMTIEQYLEKYDKYIRGLIYKRADADYRDDAYQEVVMAIIKYKDKLDSLETDAQRCAYICQIAKRTAFPQTRANKKLKTYGDFTADDNDATDPEEWFLEDETYRPDNKVDLAKRAWAEEIIDTNETLKALKKCVNKIKYGYYLNADKIRYIVHNKQHREYGKQRYQRMRQDPEYRAKNLERNRKWRETHREQLREYRKEYRQKRKEQKNEQLRHTEQ